MAANILRGKIRLRIGLQGAPRTQAQILSVSDTYKSIPHEAFERVLKVRQVEGRQGRRKMSSGLEVTFCKMVVEAHR